MSELTINNGNNNSYLEQAAILLLCLGEEAAATVMQKLSREEVVRLSENMARLSGVKTSMAKKVINNFLMSSVSRVASTALRVLCCKGSSIRRWEQKSPAA